MVVFSFLLMGIGVMGGGSIMLREIMVDTTEATKGTMATDPMVATALVVGATTTAATAGTTIAAPLRLETLTPDKQRKLSPTCLRIWHSRRRLMALAAISLHRRRSRGIHRASKGTHHSRVIEGRLRRREGMMGMIGEATEDMEVEEGIRCG